MSVEQLVQGYPILPYEDSCWAEALVCDCVRVWSWGNTLKVDANKIRDRIFGDPVEGRYGERCGHRCNNYAKDPLGLCGFHMGWYSMDVFDGERELVAA